MGSLDHLIYVCPDLKEGMKMVGKLLGVEPKVGGRHKRWGTWNAVVSLGPTVYLELLAPDPTSKPEEREGDSFWEDFGTERLGTFAIRTPKTGELGKFREEMKKSVSHDIGDPLKGSRKMPDGRELTWTICSGFGKQIVGDGVVPFVLDWHDSFEKKVHPAQTSPQGCTLLSLKATHPKPEELATIVDALCPSMKGMMHRAYRRDDKSPTHANIFC
uniref:Glyoxalase-like domain-containing protein n=1 Tax=Lotharella globosa TaxID=91324 RepID=A0A7S3Y986_9EUKA